MFTMNMDFNNCAETYVNSSSVMPDEHPFKTIVAMDYLTMLGDFVITDHLWNDEHYTDMEMQQISSSSQNYGLFDGNHDLYFRSKSNSAFKNYARESTERKQSCLTPAVKQKLAKRCLEFLRKMYKNSRDELIWEEKYGLGDESYASTHRIAERNRRNKLRQQFLALRSLLPHNSKKVDKISTLSNAIMELNRQKFRIEELEQLNQRLTNAVKKNSIAASCSSVSYGGTEDSIRDPLMYCVCEEADVRVAKHSTTDEAIIEVRMKKILSGFTYIDAMAKVNKCLREIEFEVLRIEWRELGSTNQVIEGNIRKREKGERWEEMEIKAAVKYALMGIGSP